MTDTAKGNILNLFRTVEAAEFLNVAVGTMHRWRKEGGGPRFVRLGLTGHPRYSEQALRDFIGSEHDIGVIPKTRIVS